MNSFWDVVVLRGEPPRLSQMRTHVQGTLTNGSTLFFTLFDIVIASEAKQSAKRREVAEGNRGDPCENPRYARDDAPNRIASSLRSSQ